VRLEVRVPPAVRDMVTAEAAERELSAGDVVAEAMTSRNAPRIRLISGGPQVMLSSLPPPA